MIKIVKGSEKTVKLEMRAKTLEIKEQMKKIRKRIREEKKLDDPNVDKLIGLEDELEDLEAGLNFYKPSRVLPVRINNKIIVNFKAVQRFLKVLDNFTYTVAIKGDCLLIDYGVGYVEFRNLSPYYQGFQDIPEGALTVEAVEV